jgi:hypothetical protein
MFNKNAKVIMSVTGKWISPLEDAKNLWSVTCRKLSMITP